MDKKEKEGEEHRPAICWHSLKTEELRWRHLKVGGDRKFDYGPGNIDVYEK